MSKNIVYIGKDLEAMSFATNYHKWIIDEFRPFLGKRLVEVGAGTGAFSELLLNEKPQNIHLVEPSEMFDILGNNIKKIRSRTKINLHQEIFANVCEKIGVQRKPDSIIYVNVLEHIEDDSKELSIIFQSLEVGGRCFIFVPALMSLYSKLDHKIGHFRRYTKKDLEEKCEKAGFKVLKSKYFDFLGIFPWYVKYKMLGTDSLESNVVNLYDKIVVPFARKIENKITPKLGKNILLIAEKL